MGQPAGLKRLTIIVRVKGSLVKRYYRVCDSSMIQVETSSKTRMGPEMVNLYLP